MKDKIAFKDGQISFKPTTPPHTRLSIKRFLKEVGLNPVPVFLKFTNLSDKYLKKYCLSNCEAENVINERPIVFGWTIWEDKSQQFIEAEFHSVIKINNQLVDITPRIDGEEEIMFVPDPSKSAERVNDMAWKTWKNTKSLYGKIFEHSTQVIFKDIQNNKWV